MYTGTLIDDLMNAVERAERRALAERSQEEQLEYWYAVSRHEMACFESSLAGVA
jgi:hypothetical protein